MDKNQLLIEVDFPNDEMKAEKKNWQIWLYKNREKFSLWQIKVKWINIDQNIKTSYRINKKSQPTQ